MDGELKKIKKVYGEDFAKLCRTLFPRLLDEEGRLLGILLKNFAPSHSLFDEIVSQTKVFEFKGFVYKEAGIATPEIRDIDKTPEQLLASVGYKLYRCKNDRDVKSFRKYYEKDEQLCTFRDSNRIKRCDIFFAVREDVENIKRSDFKNPIREDRYGTSVMSFQFDKEDGDLSIKNRYNHTVENPDATYSNDLDSIVPGLTDSFAKYYGIDSRIDYSRIPPLLIAHYVTDKNNRAYRFNICVGGTYFCDNNVVIKSDRTPIQYDKSRYELIGTFLIDKAEKTMRDLSGNEDSFQNLFVDVDKIETKKGENETRKIIVTKNDGTFFTIVVDKTNTMIHYENQFQTEVEEGFLKHDMMIKSVSIPNAKKIGDYFLYSNSRIKDIDLPEVEEIGSDCLKQTTNLRSMNFPKLRKVGDKFLYNATEIKSAGFPSLEETGEMFLCYASKLEYIEAPKLREVGVNAFRQCVHLKALDLPSLEVAGDMFLRDHRTFDVVSFPALRTIGKEFMFGNRAAKIVNLPAAETIDDSFMPYDEKVSSVYLPNVKKIGNKFLHQVKALREISLPEVEEIGVSFLYKNERLRKFYAPKLKILCNNAFYNNKRLREVDLPKAEMLGSWVLHSNKRLRLLSLPNLVRRGDCVLSQKGTIKKVRISNKKLIPSHWRTNDIEVVGSGEPSI